MYIMHLSARQVGGTDKVGVMAPDRCIAHLIDAALCAHLCVAVVSDMSLFHCNMRSQEKGTVGCPAPPGLSRAIINRSESNLTPSTHTCTLYIVMIERGDKLWYGREMAQLQ